MHELSVAQSILEIAVVKARVEGAARITNIRVVIGALTTYVDDSLRFYWDSIAEGTLAAGSTIEFVHRPGLLGCLSCDAQFSTTEADFQCPECGGLWTQPLDGEDCYVDAIDVDLHDPNCSGQAFEEETYACEDHSGHPKDSGVQYIRGSA
jgi:hydrogenase nickel incorporation protein HypA/HybF